MLQKIIKEDVPGLFTCGGILTFCTLSNIATVAQQIGIIAGALGAVMILVHRLYIFVKDLKNDRADKK